jgi:hypothetical protein
MKTTNKPLTPILLAIIAVLGTAVIYLAGCAGKKEADDKSSAVTAGGRTSPYCADTTCLGFNSSTQRPPGIISFKTAQMLANNYVSDEGKGFVWEGGVERTKEQDSRSIWFNLEQIKRFIGYIESAACRSGCADSLRLGLRIYFAKYPGAEDMQRIPDLVDVPREYASHHTVFMVPTYRDWNKKADIDFDPQSIAQGCKIRPLDPVKGLAWLGFAPAITGTDIQNHGSIKPPPLDTGIFPDTTGN